MASRAWALQIIQQTSKKKEKKNLGFELKCEKELLEERQSRRNNRLTFLLLLSMTSGWPWGQSFRSYIAWLSFMIMSFYLSIYFQTYTYICLSIFLCTSPSIHIFAFISFYMRLHLHIYLSSYRSMYIPTYTCICPPVFTAPP